MTRMKRWVFTRVGNLGYVLQGIVYGHPKLLDGSLITTSLIKYVDVKNKFVKTHNTRYKLEK